MFRPRFSLLTLLLLTTIVAMGVTVWRLGIEIVPLREEVGRLRDEAGRLSIDDPTRIHAVAVNMAEPDRYRWRVWVPQGRNYSLCYARFDVPLTGLPTDRQSIIEYYFEAGEHLLDFRLKLVDEKKLVAYLRGKGETNGMGTNIDLFEMKNRWIYHDFSKGRTDEVVEGIGFKNMSVAGNEPLVLFRLRAREVVPNNYDKTGIPRGWSYLRIDEPTDGLIIWIEPSR